MLYMLPVSVHSLPGQSYIDSEISVQENYGWHYEMFAHVYIDISGTNLHGNIFIFEGSVQKHLNTMYSSTAPLHTATLTVHIET